MVNRCRLSRSFIRKTGCMLINKAFFLYGGLEKGFSLVGVCFHVRRSVGLIHCYRYYNDVPKVCEVAKQMLMYRSKETLNFRLKIILQSWTSVSQHHSRKILSCFSFSSVPWLCPKQFNRRAFQSGYQLHFRPCWLSCLLAEESSSLQWYFLARKGEHIALHWINYRTMQRRDPLLVFFVFMSVFFIICLHFFSRSSGTSYTE